MARVRLELDRNYQDVLLRSRDMHRMLERVAGAVSGEARRSAPVGRYTHGGRYRDGIEPDVGKDDRGHLVGRVNAHHFTSWWIEGGTIRMRPRPVLRNALESGAARRTLR